MYKYTDMYVYMYMGDVYVLREFGKRYQTKGGEIWSNR